jgi:hypothetical protein
MWEKDVEGKGTSQGGIDLDAESDVHPEAVWRRRPSPFSTNGFILRGGSQVAPEMGRRVETSDWLSFVADRDRPESQAGDGRSSQSRQGSNDASVGVARRVSVPGFAAVAAATTTTHTGLARSNPHPLRYSFVPSVTSSSQYSPSDASTITREPASLAPPGSYPGTRPLPLPGFTDVMLEAGASTLRAPAQPGSWRMSLDRAMGSAAVYLGGKLADNSNLEEGDRYTAFKSPHAGAGPPTPPHFDAPAYPARAAPH